MNVYTNDKITGLNPIGACAVVVAVNEKNAAAELNNALKYKGLAPTAEIKDMVLLDLSVTNARILNDGEY